MSYYVQPVNQDNQAVEIKERVFSMIDNYVYLYHTKTLIVLPTYPESLPDSMGVTYNSVTPLSRSAPIYSYVSSGPRTVSISLTLHRDMLNEVNFQHTKLKVDVEPFTLHPQDALDKLISNLQSAALPKYMSKEKMVNPPMVAVRFGQTMFCKGVVTSGVNVTYTGPILADDKYAQASVDFTLNEVDPYDAVSISQLGSYRGLNTTLEREIYKTQK